MYEKFDRDRYNAIQYKAEKMAKDRGMEQYAEDFAQYAAFKISQNPKHLLRFLWVDFLREQFGRARSESEHNINQVKYQEHRGYFHIDSFFDERSEHEQVHNVQIPITEDDVKKFASSPIEESELKYYEKALRGMELAVFRLLSIGCTLQEIGDIFGVSEGRIGQHVMEIKKKLKLYGEY